MDRIEEINQQFEKRKDQDLSQVEIFYIISLIEEKIKLVLEEEDLRSFNYLIHQLQLPESDKNKLISLRNKIVHGGINESTKLEEYKKWLNTRIIPSVLEFNRNNVSVLSMTPNEYYDTIFQKLESLGMKLSKEYLMKIGNRTAVADFLIEDKEIKVIGEIKSSANVDKILGIQQIQSYLAASALTYGLLILPYSINERLSLEITDKITQKIQIIGAFDDFKTVEEWIEKNKGNIT